MKKLIISCFIICAASGSVSAQIDFKNLNPASSTLGMGVYVKL